MQRSLDGFPAVRLTLLLQQVVRGDRALGPGFDCGSEGVGTGDLVSPDMGGGPTVCLTSVMSQPRCPEEEAGNRWPPRVLSSVSTAPAVCLALHPSSSSSAQPARSF